MCNLLLLLPHKTGAIVFVDVLGTDIPAIPVAAANGIQLAIGQLVAFILGKSEHFLDALASFRLLLLLGGKVLKVHRCLRTTNANE